MRTGRAIRYFLLAMLAGFAVVVAAAIGVRDRILLRVAPAIIRGASDLDVEVEAVRTTLVPLSIQFRGIRVRNPEGFDTETDAFRIDEYFVRVDRRSFFGDERRIREVRLDVPRIVAVIDARGQTNFDALTHMAGEPRRDRPRRAAPPPAPPTRPPRESSADRPPGRAPDRIPPPEAPPRPAPDPDPPTLPPATEPAYRIDVLTIRLGELEVHDYSGGRTRPEVRRVRLGPPQVFRDVTDVNDVAMQLAFQWTLAANPEMAEALGLFFEPAPPAPRPAD